ncbi:hypothetical protein [Streptomyces vilmorinianum]|uniref:hypothetical protein n=1 Tax=Streptomyces vilmorinianum TaxID=3051092 RepID=UPI0010FB2C9B|nr:hypothetical protein [Streptomyces vilmorinianum]
MKKSLHRIALAGAVVAQAVLLALAAPAPAGAETAAGGPARQPAARAGTHVTVKAGWELARIREYARGDSAIVGEIKPGESWPCSTGGCGSVKGGHVTACATSSDQWHAIKYYGYVRYVSVTCGTAI